MTRRTVGKASLTPPAQVSPRATPEGADVGAWGEGPFDNDTAADWCADLDGAPPETRVPMIRAALDAAVEAGEYLEVDVASPAVAAAAIVASMRPGAPPVDSVYAPGFLADGVVLALPDDLPALALRALDRVTGDDSEWRELWEEAGSYEAAAATVEPLRAALAGDATGPAPDTVND
jgi:hypothetical protein